MKNIIKLTSLLLVIPLLVISMASCFNSGNNSNVGENGGNTEDNTNNENNNNNNNDNTGNEDTGNEGNNGNEDNTVYFTGKQSVLLIGQSNMAGRGFAEDVEPISDDRITMLNSSNEWVKMQEPIHYDKSAAGVGLAASFAKAFVETFDCELGLIPAAMGGTSISDWKVGGTYYNDAIARAKEAQKTSEICAILWHQGESNRSNHSTYAEKLQTILDAMIAELGLDADKIVIITGELREISTNVNQRETFHAQLNQLSSVYKNYGVADADGLSLNNDIIHFDAPSLRVFGYRYFNIFKTLVTGTGYEFVDDRDYYYVGADKDPNPNNSGKYDLPSDNPGGGDIGGGGSAEGKTYVEGNIIADTYISSSNKDDPRDTHSYIGTNKDSSRPIFKFNVANILADPGFDANKNDGKFEFTFTFYEGGSTITADTLASAYGFLPGAGVSDADFSEVTWNTCKTGAMHAGLYRGGATFIYKDKALGELDVVKTDDKITFILNYSDIKQFICTEEGDNYGILVMGFDFKAGGVKFASMENTTYDIPKVDFVYGGDYSSTVESVFDVVSANPDTELYFVGSSNKDALKYAVGEEMSFDIYLYADDKIVSAPYFYYSIEGEDGQAKTEGYVDGSKGYFTVKGSMSKAGTLRVTVYVCDANKNIQKKSSGLYIKNRNGAKEDLCFCGGAVAGFNDIQSYGSAPSDLESYWSNIVADCYTGNINLLRFEELDVADYNTEKVSTHKLYLVEIDVGGGEFATGYLTVPVNGDSIRIKASFVSYGNTKKPSPAFTSDAAVFTICAHSYHLDDPNASAPDNYGFNINENQNRDTVYFNKMFIRNIIAARFLKAYIGNDSYGTITYNGATIAPLGRWQVGVEFLAEGGSQAAFQAVALTALDKDVTRASVALTWFCDIGGENIGRFDGWNPEYTDALMYYDCCSLATLIDSDVEVSISGAGLGDTTSEPTGIIAFFNALNCKASLKMYQNRSHTYNPPVADAYTISK